MKRLVILGGGESGVGTAVLAKKKGFEVFLSDKGKLKESYKDVLSQHEIKWEEEQHTEELILNADEVVKIVRKENTGYIGNRICRKVYKCKKNLYHR